MSATATMRLLLPLALAMLLPAEIVDRVAVAVGRRVITTSDIERDIRITAFLNASKPDLSPVSKRVTADRLTDQLLIRQEVESSGYELPSAKDVQPMIDKLRAERFKDEAEYRASLAAFGITEPQLVDALVWQRAFLLFVDERFRPAVQVEDKEIEDYFVKNVAPAARAARPGTEPTLDEFRTQIEDAIVGKRVDSELEKWLEVKRRTRILIYPEAFQ